MGVKLTFYGHACFLIEGGGAAIIVDPFLNGNPLAPVKAEAIKADYVLVSHGHGDHLGDTVEIAKRNKATVISNFEIATYCQNQGVEAHPLHIGGGWNFPFGRVKLTVAHHGSALPDGSYGGNPCGFLISIEGVKVYHAGDTSLTYDMKLIGEEGIDVALLPIGDNFTMGPDDALRAVKLLEPKVVIPMHYDTFDVIKQDPEAFAKAVEEQTSAKAVVLKPGESFTYP
ncbi:MAG TPA: metal-dependent hydrolase [Chloroflexi bacterium]|nr:metal-dependent hydrolase [Chloroflexota bacterium]